MNNQSPIDKQTPKNRQYLDTKYQELRNRLTTFGYVQEKSKFTKGGIYYFFANLENDQEPNKGILIPVRTTCSEMNEPQICKLIPTNENIQKQQPYIDADLKIKRNEDNTIKTKLTDEIWKKGTFASMRGAKSAEAIKVEYDYNLAPDVVEASPAQAAGGRKSRKSRKSRRSRKSRKTRSRKSRRSRKTRR